MCAEKFQVETTRRRKYNISPYSAYMCQSVPFPREKAGSSNFIYSTKVKNIEKHIDWESVNHRSWWVCNAKIGSECPIGLMIASQGMGNIHTCELRINLEVRITWLSNVESSHYVITSAPLAADRIGPPASYYYSVVTVPPDHGRQSSSITKVLKVTIRSLPRLTTLTQLLCCVGKQVGN